MPEDRVIAKTPQPRTRRSLGRDLRHLGLHAGDLVLMHSSLSSLGWVAGGAPAVVLAVLDVLGPEGTVVVPTQTGDNSDPKDWSRPPVPKDWWPVIRAEMPAYDPATTPTRGMGRIVECLRTWPGARRSAHPQVSFAALGRLADEVTRNHPFDDGLGEASPLGLLYRLDAKVLLLGVGYDSATALHLAEYRVEGMPRERYGVAALVGGERQWITYSDVEHLDADEIFPRIGEAYEGAHPVVKGQVGSAAARLLPMRTLVDFGTIWLSHAGPSDNT